ncbi:MAG: BRCT domain-containing protein [Clostridia bacterium]|nr:BRCT domain-containing protein [Clostridia bacterium]
MKFRTDFVTNSSSSSFSVVIEVMGPNDKKVWVEIDPTDTYTYGGGEASFNVANLKALTGIDSVSDLAKALTDSVTLLDYTDPESDEECPNESLKKLSQKYDDDFLKKMTKDLDDFESALRSSFFNTSDISFITITQTHKAWGEFVRYGGTVKLLTKEVKPHVYEKFDGSAEEEWESICLHMRSGSVFSETSGLDIHAFKGKRFFIAENCVYREDAEDFIDAFGGTVVSTISRNVDYLITNDPKSTTAEIKEALELNIPIISENDFEMIFDWLAGV